MIASAIRNGNANAAVLSQVAKDGGFAFMAIVDEADNVITSTAGIANVNDAEIRAAIGPNIVDADSRFNVFTAPIKDGKRLVIVGVILLILLAIRLAGHDL